MGQYVSYKVGAWGGLFRGTWDRAEVLCRAVRGAQCPERGFLGKGPKVVISEERVPQQKE